MQDIIGTLKSAMETHRAKAKEHTEAAKAFDAEADKIAAAIAALNGEKSAKSAGNRKPYYHFTEADKATIAALWGKPGGVAEAARRIGANLQSVYAFGRRMNLPKTGRVLGRFQAANGSAHV